MVNSRTTVYTYGKANQLVSSECNGKITKYEYDAAGRLVKEGKRSYSYSWLDKVNSVKENGVEVASFTCHMDGQIATAKANGRQEHFLWDNLALTSRNETEYVNEPYVTGAIRSLRMKMFCSTICSAVQSGSVPGRNIGKPG